VLDLFAVRFKLWPLNQRSLALFRDNMRLKAEKLHDTSSLTKQKKQIIALEAQVAWQGQHNDELLQKLQEQASLADMSTFALDDMKGKIRELETVGFVMTDRANRFSEEVKPRREEVARLTEQRSLQDQDLARSLRLVDSLKMTVQQKETIVRCAADADTLCVKGDEPSQLDHVHRAGDGVHIKCRNLKDEVMHAQNVAAGLRTTIEQFKGDFARAWSQSDVSTNGKPSEHVTALRALSAKWLSSKAQGRVEVEDIAHTLQKQVLVTELKADLAQSRTKRIESSTKASVAHKVHENMQLMAENTSLRRDKKLLRDALHAANLTIEDLRSPATMVSCLGRSAEGLEATPTVVLGGAADAPSPSLQLAVASPRPCSAGAITSYFASLGSPAAPSRPVSAMLAPLANLSRAEPQVALNPHRPRPHSAMVRPVRQLPTSSQRRRPLSGLERGSRGIAHFSPARALTELVGQKSERVVSLEAQLSSRERTIEEQQAQIRLLHTTMHHHILEGEEEDDGSTVELVFQQDTDAATCREAAASAVKPVTGQAASEGRVRPRSALEARLLTGNRAGALAASQGVGGATQRGSLVGRRRPTSAGGMNVQSARSSFQR
jgi:hypothetical protein